MYHLNDSDYLNIAYSINEVSYKTYPMVNGTITIGVEYDLQHCAINLSFKMDEAYYFNIKTGEEYSASSLFSERATRDLKKIIETKNVNVENEYKQKKKLKREKCSKFNKRN